MSRTKVEETDSYFAEDETGKQHRITVYTSFIEVRSLNESEWIPGLQSHKMQNGNHVNVLKDGELEEVQTGRKMKRI